MVTLRVDHLDRGLTIPLDNELFTVFGVGASIGLGIYFAWVNRDWSARTKKTRFVVVAGGEAGRWMSLIPGWGYGSRSVTVEIGA